MAFIMTNKFGSSLNNYFLSDTEAEKAEVIGSFGDYLKVLESGNVYIADSKGNWIFFVEEDQGKVIVGDSEISAVDFTNLKNSVTNHIGDSVAHTTSSEKNIWNSHISNTNIHVNPSDKSEWNHHIEDADIHVNLSEKNEWNQAISTANEARAIANIAAATSAVAGERAELGINHALAAHGAIDDLAARVAALEARFG